MIRVGGAATWCMEREVMGRVYQNSRALMFTRHPRLSLRRHEIVASSRIAHARTQRRRPWVIRSPLPAHAAPSSEIFNSEIFNTRPACTAVSEGGWAAGEGR